jgi:glycosyltransferase involved in cell wall biosynthesis
MTTDKLKVFHGLVNYGTQAGIISKTLREEFNIKSISVVTADPFKRQIDIELLHGGNFMSKVFKHSWNNIRKIYWLFTYNTFHFYFGKTFFKNQIDLPFYKLLGKKVVMHYLGNDVEQYQWSLDHYKITNMEFMMTAEVGKKHDEKVKKRVAYESKYIDYKIVCAPQYSPFVPDAQVIPLTVDLSKFKFCQLPYFKNNEPLRVLHAATSRKKKGTEYLIDAVDQLKKEGYKIELDLCEGITHNELVKQYKKCHVSVVALLGGWYGTAAIEAMATGRPIISFIRPSFFKYVDIKEEEIPIINANRDTIYYELKKVLDYSKDDLQKLAEKTYNFVHKYHEPKKVTNQIVNVYKKVWKID